MPLMGACRELGWCEPVEARMWPVGVVVDSPVFDDPSCLVEVGEEMLVEALVSQAAVEAFDKSVLQRLARCNVVPLDLLSSCQASRAFDVNSVPLSLMIMQGQPRLSMIRSSSRATRRAVSEVSATRPRHSRVKSSTRVRIRKRRPLTSVSITKSSGQRRLASCGIVIGAACQGRACDLRLRTDNRSSL